MALTMPAPATAAYPAHSLMPIAKPRRRGFAMGINECAGYAAVAGAGIVSAIAAGHYGLRAGAAYPGVIIAALGLLFSWFVRDTGDHVRLEASQRTAHISLIHI